MPAASPAALLANQRKSIGAFFSHPGTRPTARTMNPSLIDLIYLVSSGLMLAGIWQYLKPGRARQGNLLGGAGVLLAVLATLTAGGMISIGAALVGLLIGVGLGAFIGTRATTESAPAWIAVLVAATGLSSALIAGAILHDVGAIYDAAHAALDKEWEGKSDALRQANVTIVIPFAVSWATALSAAIAAASGGVIAASGVICHLKLTKSALRKSLPKFDQPRLFQMGLLVVCLLFGLLLTLWPGTETFLWLLLLTAMGLGYSLTIHLKIVDVPPVLAATVSLSGLSLAAAGIVTRNTLMVTAGALVASGAAVVAQSICHSLHVSLPGLIDGSQSSKTSAPDDADAPPPAPKPAPIVAPIVSADPNAPIL